VARAFWTSTSRASDAPVEGLSIAFSIVRAARGTMRFETRRRRGTVVHCYLPVAHSA
jgi:signal transduction histidine kinase